ncbi:tyrosine-protein kinase-like otk isoform X2 [Leptinotarsa decemlineata]|uniref:tyrosine-protein kinase-like otk isoform X2 n=1 Tax=Leptinotarsa decemlineata TaxID=7539 RepID=UPI003D30CCF3
MRGGDLMGGDLRGVRTCFIWKRGHENSNFGIKKAHEEATEGLGCFVQCREELYFSKSPKDVKVVLGTSVTLPCEVTPSSGVVYYWELNGSKISNTTRRHQQGSNLHITRVDRERDSGQFTCIAEDTTGQSTAITSSPASINIQWIGEATVQLQEPESASFIERGSNVTLRCHLDASGEVHFEWFRNADRLTKSARLEIKKRRIHIKSVEATDNGVYRCVAKNEAGVQHSTKNFALAVPGETTALIQIVPSDLIIKNGGIAFFDCSYQHADVTEWYFEEKPLSTNERITIHSNGTLQINDVTESDQGLYNCVGIRSESTEVPQSYTAKLKIAYIEPFVLTSFEPPLPDSKKKIVGEGLTFQLTCLPTNSSPPAKQWWERPNGHTISDSGDVRVDDGRLIIDNVKSENAGRYKCVAENIAGITEMAVELMVTTKPKILVHPVSVTVDENEESILHCEFESDSRQHTIVKWRKDGKYLKHDDESSSYQRLKIFKTNGTLVIHSTQAADRGEYVCEVITVGQKPVASKPATISVIEQLRFVPAPVNKKMELGSIAKVHCKAQGTPPPIIRWEKEGVQVDNLTSHITDMNGTLHFNGVQSEDKGRYNCIASNSQGTINASINIEVVVAPRFNTLPKNPTEAIEGQSVSIDCVVEGDPKPTIQWDKNLKMNDFDLARFKVLSNGTLLISEVHREDENKYGCTAGSSAGLNRKEVQLIVHTQEADGDSTVTKAVLITMSVAGAYIILVIGLMVWCRYRRRSRKLPLNDGKTENGDIEHTELKEALCGNGSDSSKPKANGIENHKEGQRSDGAETTHSQSSNNSKKSKSSNYDKLALSRSHLKDIKLIGRGEFGDIMIAKIAKTLTVHDKRASRSSQITSPEEVVDDKEVPVLIKALSQTKDEGCLTEFKREIDIFSKITNENITKLFGLCREVEPNFMILEYTDWGDLKKFLVATQNDNSPPLTSVQSVAIIQQISRGMDHLASNRIVHKDLAARNCLITSTLVAKVGLPRLTRDPYSQEYCKHVNQIIPLRWLPHEAVYEDEYSTKSDVYSFGVLMWEVFARGELPHSKINDNSFLTKLKEKKLEWKSHPSTPESLIKWQESCWDLDPQNRPSFSELSKELAEILKSM